MSKDRAELLSIVKVEPEQACASWRWIGVKKDPAAPCPQPRSESWTARRLFYNETSSGTEDGARDGVHLSSFCVYQSSRPVSSIDVDQVVNPEAFETLDRDCLGVTTSACTEAMAGQIWQDLRIRFGDQVGEVDLPRPANTKLSQPVRLALLDTAATRAETNRDHPANHRGNSPHGFTLANLARDLVDQNVRITTRLALPWVHFDPHDPRRSKRDDVRGGHTGLLSDLATAIKEEVDAWQQDDPERRLVLNLSLGWDPDLYGGVLGDGREVASEPAGVRAVRTALEYAAVHGAVIVAAAGNVLGPPSDDEGALLPAGWERASAPSVARCRELLGQDPPACRRLEQEQRETGKKSVYGPLVHAAGGLHGHGGTVANARPGSLPRLMTYSAGAVTRDPSRRHTATLVGSSVAALVASATTSAVWSLAPDMAGHQVVDLAYGSGQTLGESAELHWGATPPERHRVELCRAVRAVCATGVCDPPRCRRRPRELPPPEFEVPANASHKGPVEVPAAPVPGVCGNGYKMFHAGKGAPPWMCPFAQLPGVAHHGVVGPQPQSTPCPNCSLIPDPSGYRLLIEISCNFNAEVSQPVLHINGEALALPLGSMQPGEVAEVTGMPEPEPGKAVHMTFVVGQDQGSAQSPVMVLP